MFDLDQITRKNIQQLNPYQSARSQFSGKADIWLNANENPNETNLNRYPDPLHIQLKKQIAGLKKVEKNQIFLGNGSDEAIDLLMRAFCEPNQNKVFIFPPTFGMYEILATINHIEVLKIHLQTNFTLPPLDEITKYCTTAGIIFICSPNNPTGNSTDLKQIKKIAENFNGIVAVDEAYIDFSKYPSSISMLDDTPNLVVLQTFSKAYGLAGARVGMAFASEKIIAILNKIKPPYNVSTISKDRVLNRLKDKESVNYQILEIQNERQRMEKELAKLDYVIRVYPSDANFLLVTFFNADKVYDQLIQARMVVRNVSAAIKNSLRITIGTPIENGRLLQVLKKIQA